MTIPCRCNLRSCQKRRNLAKRPERYVHRPRCRQPDCKGLMYVDEYRLRKGPHDHSAVCVLDCLPYPHRVSTPQCKQYEGYVSDRNTADRSKHSPIRQADWVPF